MLETSVAPAAVSMVVLLVSACGGSSHCAPGTVERGGDCVAAGDGDADADGDTDGDADADGDADGGACVHECRAAGRTQCNADLVERCTVDADGCRRWLENQDCAEQGLQCVVLGVDAACGGCNRFDACDPDCGGVGAPCRNDRECEIDNGDLRLPLSCIAEEQSGFPGGYCAALPSLASPNPCDPADDLTCPAAEGGVCVEDTVTGSYCLRSCDVTDENWSTSNCGCRAGYECDISNEVCLPGCRTEEPRQSEDCCRRWVDTNGDGLSTLDELSNVENCTSTCDPNTYRCVGPGTSGAAIGGSCLSDQDCPENGRCIGERGTGDGGVDWEGGYCVLEACDLDGRACPRDSTCADVDSDDEKNARGIRSWPWRRSMLGGGADFYRASCKGWCSWSPVELAWAHPLCLASCTVADSRIADAFADHNPQCRDGYGCTGTPDVLGNDTCTTDDDCGAGVHCIGGVCNGNGYCLPLVERLNPHIHLCDTAAYPDTGCPGDDVDTAGWDEAQRCVDGVCQAPCDGGHVCAADTECADGSCQWSNVGGPCADATVDPPVPNDAACVSPYGQGFCAWGAVFGNAGTCLLASCDAPGVEDTCGEGKTCEALFGGHYCVDACDVAAADCMGEDNCQGLAVGCREDFACHSLQADVATGVCLASCSLQDDPDQFCADSFGAALTCNLDTGTCVE